MRELYNEFRRTQVAEFFTFFYANEDLNCDSKPEVIEADPDGYWVRCWHFIPADEVPALHINAAGDVSVGTTQYPEPTPEMKPIVAQFEALRAQLPDLKAELALFAGQIQVERHVQFNCDDRGTAAFRSLKQRLELVDGDLEFLESDDCLVVAVARIPCPLSSSTAQILRTQGQLLNLLESIDEKVSV